jgi:hypothetical protein
LIDRWEGIVHEPGVFTGQTGHNSVFFDTKLGISVSDQNNSFSFMESSQAELLISGTVGDSSRGLGLPPPQNQGVNSRTSIQIEETDD